MKYQDFSFCQKIISSLCAVKILYLSFTCDNIGVAMVTNIISQLLSLFLLYNFNIFVTRHFAIGDHFNCTCCFENEYKKSCVLCRNFISSYKIKRTLHGGLGIQILSSSAESISHESQVSEANE